MAEEGLHDGRAAEEFNGILTKIVDEMRPAATYQILRRMRQIRR